MKKLARYVRRLFRDRRIRKVLLQLVRDLKLHGLHGEALSSNLLALRKHVISGRLKGIRFTKD